MKLLDGIPNPTWFPATLMFPVLRFHTSRLLLIVICCFYPVTYIGKRMCWHKGKDYSALGLPTGLRPAVLMACAWLMWGRRPRGNWIATSLGLREGMHRWASADATGKLGLHRLTGCINPVADYQKHARNISSGALRGRIWGSYVADDQSMGYMGL
jgi:hypothetical protein